MSNAGSEDRKPSNPLRLVTVLVLILVPVLGLVIVQSGQRTEVSEAAYLPPLDINAANAPGGRDRIATSTFLQLRGRAYTLPDPVDHTGGALTHWGNDLILVTGPGGTYHRIEGQEFVASGLALPDNGLADYKEVAETEPYKDLVHEFFTYRYNDIEFIETPDLRGLAVSYTYFRRDGACYGTRIDWLDIPEAVGGIADLTNTPADWTTVYESTPCLPLTRDFVALQGWTAGGRITFAAPSTLYIGMGDYHLDGIATAAIGVERLDNDYGKVLAIDLPSGEKTILSRGHRNVQGIAVDQEGRVWSVEHGMRGGDELNLVKPGRDFGWPRVTLGTLYNNQPIPVEGVTGRHDFYDLPAYAWLPSPGLSAMIRVDGFDPAWEGDLLAGSLATPLRGQSLHRIRIDGERVVFAERIPINGRVRDLEQLDNGRIAVWFDNYEVVVYGPESFNNSMTRMETHAVNSYSPAMEVRVLQTLNGCNQCHSYDREAHDGAPSLHGLFGRDIGGTAYQGYSQDLLQKPGVWNADTLFAFLHTPDEFAPGSSMPASGLAGADPSLVRAVIETLQVLAP